jgi:hypothetical protein
MQYLVISADINYTGIKEEFGKDLEREQLKVSDKLWEELSLWVLEYMPIIPLDLHERKIQSALIADLDRRGMELRQKFVKELGDVKIKYYSEGLLKYLD